MAWRGHVDSISRPFSRLGNKTLASIIYLHYRYFTPTRTRRIYGEIIQHYFVDMNKMTAEIYVL